MSETRKLPTAGDGDLIKRVRAAARQEQFLEVVSAEGARARFERRLDLAPLAGETVVLAEKRQQQRLAEGDVEAGDRQDDEAGRRHPMHHCNDAAILAHPLIPFYAHPRVLHPDNIFATTIARWPAVMWRRSFSIVSKLHPTRRPAAVTTPNQFKTHTLAAARQLLAIYGPSAMKVHIAVTVRHFNPTKIATMIPEADGSGFQVAIHRHLFSYAL